MSAARLAASTGAGKELPVRVGGGLWGGGGGAGCWLLGKDGGSRRAAFQYGCYCIFSPSSQRKYPQWCLG